MPAQTSRFDSPAAERREWGNASDALIHYDLADHSRRDAWCERPACYHRGQLAGAIRGISDKPKGETINEVLYLSPGSAGPRRFTPPISLATLVISDHGINPEIYDISP